MNGPSSGAHSLGPRLDAVLSWRWQPAPPVFLVELMPMDPHGRPSASELTPGARVILKMGSDRLVLEHRTVAGTDPEGARHLLVADHPITRARAFSGTIASCAPERGAVLPDAEPAAAPAQAAS
jgi:hypothetical protein